MKLRTVFAAVSQHLGRRDLIAILGLASLSWGVWEVWPAAWGIVVGVILLYIALFWRAP